MTRYDNTMMMVTSRTPAQFEELFKRAGYDMLRRTKQKSMSLLLYNINARIPQGVVPCHDVRHPSSRCNRTSLQLDQIYYCTYYDIHNYLNFWYAGGFHIDLA